MLDLIFILILITNPIYCLVKVDIQKSVLRNRPNTTIKLNTRLGNIIGYKQIVENKTINIFYGVPYAQPPVGKLRFEETKLIDKFPNQTYYATDFKPHCAMLINKLIYHEDDEFSEDCLYMNIFAPNLESIKLPNGTCTENFSTMIYILGANSSIYEQSPLTNQNNQTTLAYNGELFPALTNTILVLFNYRQGIFSSLVSNKFKGNLVLKDQNLALKWVKKNIKDYCGNPNSLTVFGHSFGSGSLSIHLISKKSNYMIRNAILQSRAPFLFFDAIPVRRENVLINSILAINKLGCLNLKNLNHNLELINKNIKLKYFNYHEKGIDLNKLFKELEFNWFNFEQIDDNLLNFVKFLSKYAVDSKCLKEIDTKKLIDLNVKYNNAIWQIYIDNDFIDKKSYLMYKLYNRLNTNSKLNLLIGSSSDENCKIGLELKNKYYTNQFTPPKIPKEDAKLIIANSKILKNVQSNFSELLSNVYTNKSTLKGYYGSILNFLNEYQYQCPSHFYSYFASLSSNAVYSYYITEQFTKHYMSSLVSIDSSKYSWLGACHGDEITFLFGLPFRVPNQFTQLDRDFSVKLINLWTSFARDAKMYLSNGSEWPKSNSESPLPKYIEINSKYIRENKFDFEDRCNKYYRPLLSKYMK